MLLYVSILLLWNLYIFMSPQLTDLNIKGWMRIPHRIILKCIIQIMHSNSGVDSVYEYIFQEWHKEF